MQIVNFHESNSNGIVYAAHDRGVIACWQICNDRRLPWVTRCVATVLDFLHLVMGDNPADYRSLPVIIAADQSAGAIVQFQCRISQRIGNSILTELRANGTNNHSLWCSRLDDNPAYHHVVACLHKGPSTDIAEDRIGTGAKIVHFRESNSSGAVHSTHDRSVVARWQVCDDSRFPCVTRCMAAVQDITNLIVGDNPADDRRLPVIVRGNQSAAAIVQFQCWVSQRTGNVIWRRTKLRTNGANNHPFGGRTLHDKTTNHHVVSRLNRDASGNVAELCTVCCSVEPVHLIGIRRVGATSCSPAAPTSADAEAATRILPGGSVIRCDRAIAPAPFALSAKGNVGLDLNPVGAGAEHSRTRQVYGERTAVLLDWLMSRAVDLRARKASVVGIKKYIPIDGWSHSKKIRAISVDRLHIPSLTCRHDKVVGQIGTGSRKVGECRRHGDVGSGVIVLVVEDCLRRARWRWSEHNVCAKPCTGELRNLRDTR